MENQYFKTVGCSIIPNIPAAKISLKNDSYKHTVELN